MEKKLKKTIYIPIEIKQREYLSNLLIAINAVEKGFKIYIGTKAQIFDLLLNKSKKGGIFLYKGGLEPKIFCDKISKTFLARLNTVRTAFRLSEKSAPANNSGSSDNLANCSKIVLALVWSFSKALL